MFINHFFLLKCMSASCLYVYFLFVLFFVHKLLSPVCLQTGITFSLYIYTKNCQKSTPVAENRRSELDEAVLLNDWALAKFFPPQFNDKNKNGASKEGADLKKLHRQSRSDLEDVKNKYKDNINQSSRNKNNVKEETKPQTDKISAVFNMHRRQESDSRIHNPFFRGFRRENSDWFPLSSTRHSAIYIPKNEATPPSNPLRSSGIFNNNRRPAKGEPVLTDFIKMNDSLKMSSQGEIKKIQKKDKGIKKTENTSKNSVTDDKAKDQVGNKTDNSSDSPTASISSSIAYSGRINSPSVTDTDKEGQRITSDFIADYLRRPRREKTESDIVYRNSLLATRDLPFQVTHRQGTWHYLKKKLTSNHFALLSFLIFLTFAFNQFLIILF